MRCQCVLYSARAFTTTAKRAGQGREVGEETHGAVRGWVGGCAVRGAPGFADNGRTVLFARPSFQRVHVRHHISA